MLTRRGILVGLGAIAGGACKTGSNAEPSKPSWPRTTRHEGVEVLELFPNDADESAPLVVMIHGMGGTPNEWADAWRTFPKRVHVALPRAFDAYGRGFSWFEFKDGMTDEQFGAAVGAAEARLWKAIAHVAGKRRVIVTGFSQGGILSFAIASRHPDAVVRAFPIAGSCPGPLLPKDKAKAAPILAFHGTADNVLAIKWGREAVNAFKEQGNEAEMREYEGIGHTVTPRIQREVFEEIAKAVG